MNMHSTPVLMHANVRRLLLLALVLLMVLGLALSQPDSCLYHFGPGGLYDCAGNLLLP